MSYETKIILDSIAPSGGRLTTFQFTLPRIVLAEFNTHRIFSRNSASSRAIPVEKMIKRVEDDPFVPVYLGKNQRGMRAESELDTEQRETALRNWNHAKDHALGYARMLAQTGLHKQLTNRLLEPWLWHTIVCTATEYENYFALRDNPQAAPEIRDSAHAAQELYRKNEPTLVPGGQWHLPFVTGYDVGGTWVERELIAMSAGRCAAVSYLNQDNQLDPVGDIRRTWDRLLPGGHMSPSEHPAQSLTHDQWVAEATLQSRRWIYDRIPVGNFWGWLQWRKTLQNEHDFGKIVKGSK